MLRGVLVLVAAFGLSGCAAEKIWAPDEAVRAAAYVHNGPPEIALVTSISNRTGEGAHSALLINGSQRILFDPAGNWKSQDRAPERNDVRFGMTPQMEANFLGYQSYGVYHAVVQRVTVSPQVAERAMQLAMSNGAVAPAMCASATSGILKQLPGFENVKSSMFPKSLMESFANVPGVKTTIIEGAPPKDEANLPLNVSPVIKAAVAAGR